ncbi:MAG: hypothetical protein KGN34_05930 [Sphingomonadales bacterium]|nr:hypothetical protein [Sphingomonadales bacterium]
MLSLTRNKPIGKAVIAATLAATAIGGLAATPAQAQYYHGYRHHGGGDAGVAVGAGLLGLAVGAAIASSDRPHYYYRERAYEPAYYPAYYGYPGYYAQPYPVYRHYYRDDWRWHHRPAYGYGYGYGHGWRHR